MNESRMGHSSVALTNGEILVCGGYDGSSYLSSAEIWNQDEDNWTTIEPMNEIRYTASAIRLDDGRVLVSGGWDGDAVNHSSTEIFNPEFEIWEEGPDMSVGRSFHQMTRLNDGKILITGGFDGSLNSVSIDIFDPETNMITAAADMSFGRSSHTATLMNNGKVLIVGGFNPDFGFQMSQCELYDPAGDSLSYVPALDNARDNHGAILLEDGRVLVAGGRFFNIGLNLFEGMFSYEIYNPEFNAWTGSGTMNIGQSYNHLYHFDDRLLCVGSADHTGNLVITTTSPTSEFISGNWSESTDYAAEGRYLYSSAKFHEEYIVVTGGEESNTAEIYFTEEIISVDEQIEHNEVLFPNPFNDILNFTFDPSNKPERIEVFNASGSMCFDLQLSNKGNSIETHQWPSGFYLVRVCYSDGLVWTERVVKH